MRADDPNLEHLVLIARALREFCREVVFVGGSVAGLLLTDPLATSIRATHDVDAILKVSNRSEFYRVEKRLSGLGFKRDISSAVICRWQHASSGVPFDLMPTDADILGFSNPWYPEAIDSAWRARISSGVEIRVISGPSFLATKLCAFVTRGEGDILASHDFEDILNLVDGRPSLAEELSITSVELQTFVREQIRSLLTRTRLKDYLPGLLTDENRVSVVLSRLQRIAD